MKESLSQMRNCFHAMRHVVWITTAGCLLLLGCQQQKQAAPRKSAVGQRAAGPAAATPPAGSIPGVPVKMDRVVKIPMGDGGEVLEALQSGKPVNPEMLARAAAKAQGAGQGSKGMPAFGKGGLGKPGFGKPQAAAAGAGGHLDRAVGQRALNTVVKFYELVTAKKVNVKASGTDSGMWRFVLLVTVRDKQVEQVIYVSGNGRMMFEGGVSLNQEYAMLKRHRAFADCLVENKVRIFGDSRGKTTQAQLKIIGKFAGSVFIDCAQNPKNCARLGVKTMPTFAVGKDMTPGVQNRGFLETATGCK